MSYRCFATKYRPKTFSEVVGQSVAVKFLRNSLFKKKIFPFYIFSGPFGSGKTTLARLFAAALNCHKYEEFIAKPLLVEFPCAECDSCMAVRNSHHMDFIEVDAASNTGVADMERVLSSVSLMPQQGTKKIYLIDEAHMLSKSAMSAMLKILEEPNDHTVFLFATTDPQKIIHPVRSRSTQVFCHALTIQEISDNLSEIAGKEEITFEHDALKLIARRANGSVRDSLMLFEQIFITSKTVSLNAVRDMSGTLATESDIIDALYALDTKGMADALRILEPYIRSSPRDLWQSILDAVIIILATHYKVKRDGHEELTPQFMEKWPLNRINQCMKKINETAIGFQKTISPRMLVELLIYDIGSTSSNK